MHFRVDGGQWWDTPLRALGRQGPGCWSNLLVFFREHDGQDAPRQLRIRRVGRAALHVLVVTIDLEHDGLAVDVERRAPVSAPRHTGGSADLRTPGQRRGTQ